MIAMRGAVARRGLLYTACASISLVALPSCERDTRLYMAMGHRVGEVTQDSAIVWTRITRHPERNWTGVREPRKRGARVDEYLPSRTQVAERHGAVPGAPGELRVVYWASGERPERHTDWVAVDASSDFGHRFALSGLQPRSRYRVRVEARASEGAPISATSLGSFGTPATADRWQDLRFAAVTGQAYWDLDHPRGFEIYEAMRKLKLDFLVATGDSVYLDSEEPRARTVELARHHWHRMYSLPRLVRFHRDVPGYWQIDDHDSCCDDDWPGIDPEWMKPLTFEAGVRVFRESVPIGERTWRTVRWGRGLQLWLVENRLHRSPNSDPDGPGKSIWGEEQRRWLERTLLESDADFRILVSPTPIVGPDRPQKADNHANTAFAWEGERFRAWTREQRLDNLFVVSGDRHWQYLSIDPVSRLHEFASGPASDAHAEGSPGRVPGMQPFHRVRGGFLSVSVQRRDGVPLIALRHHDVRGEVVFEFSRSAQD